MKFKLRAWLAGMLVLIVVLASEFFLEHRLHSVFDVFGFYAWLGFGVCLLMVVVSLLVGRVLKRRDDYYGD